MPWLFLPVLLAVVFVLRFEFGLALGVPELYLPFAAWVGYQFGNAGFKLIAVVTVLLFFSYSADFGGIDVRFGVGGGGALAGLLFAWLASDRDHLDKLVTTFFKWRYFIPIMIILPFTYQTPNFSGLSISTNGILLSYMMFFLMGLTKEDQKKSYLLLVASFAIGIGFRLLTDNSELYRDVFSSIGRIVYQIDVFSELYMVVFYYLGGRWLKLFLGQINKPQPSDSVPALLPTMPFSLGIVVFMICAIASVWIEFQITGVRYVSGLMGSTYLAFFSCFLAGVAYGKRAFFLIAGVWLPLFLIMLLLEPISFPPESDVSNAITIHMRGRNFDFSINLFYYLIWCAIGAEFKGCYKRRLSPGT